MVWKLEYDDSFKDDLSRIGLNDARAVLLYLNREIVVREDPRSVGIKHGVFLALQYQWVTCNCKNC